MPADAFALALAAAVLHALWNVLLARTRDPQAATAAAFCMAVAIFVPVAAVRWRMEPGVWKYVAASAAFELAYVLLLSAAYVRAPLSVFYPIARGLAPVLVLVVAVAALGAMTSWEQALGVCAVGAGILLVRGRRPDRAATVFGLTIATTIAGYTLIDNTGVTLADPISYLEAVMVGPALVTAAVVAVRQGTPALRGGFRRETLAIAPLTLAPYALALYALRLAPAAPVAAVRETSVLFATLLAALLLKERVSVERAAGAAIVVAGAILLIV
jgi:drug/metabolite transporter (DMT)-like permease